MPALILTLVLLIATIVVAYLVGKEEHKQICLRHARNTFLWDGVEDDEFKYRDMLEDERIARKQVINESDK